MGLKYKFLQFILLIVILWFPFSGTECSKLTEQGTTSVIGSWELVKMLGNSQDVCLGEVADFQSTGSATLTCPNTTPVQRSYTFSNNILTYTDNNVSYTVEFSVQGGIQKMVLTGRNGIERELTYNQISK